METVIISPAWLKLSVGATLALAVAAFITIFLTYLIRRKDRELLAKSIALDEIRNWLNEATRIILLATRAKKDEKIEARKRIENHIVMITSVAVQSGIFGEEVFNRFKKACDSFRELGMKYLKRRSIKLQEYLNLVDALYDVVEDINKQKIDILPKGFKWR